MKKIVFIFALILSTGMAFAQSIFDKYEDYDAVTSVIATDEMFKLLKEIEPESTEAKDEISMLSDLTGLKVFATDDAKIGNEMKADADAYAKSKQMKELLRINDQGAKVRFYIIRSDKPHFAKQLVMIVNELKSDKNHTIVMLVTGNIDLRKLSKLNKKVKIVDGKYFKKVEEEENE